ncbi:MAG TPA: hypothetical protein VK083_14960 [Nocardia sp.]|uniref:hypothetical protein n=1 Tax=Nocardia TaxID=1817 RepID=UPI0024564143|nr:MULTISPECIES: hypothetical protein [Nocardia]HLS78080.1 hypothetical protein [Nocardia sp.]
MVRHLIHASLVLAATVVPLTAPAIAAATPAAIAPPAVRPVADSGSSAPIESGTGGTACREIPCPPPALNIWDEIFEVYYSILVATGSASWGDLPGQNVEPTFPGSGSSGSAD